MPVTITFADNTTLECDGVLRQGHERRNEVTKHPVETGADVSDNIRQEPVVVSIEGIISATPLPGAQGEDDPNRHITAFNQLTDAVSKRQLIKIATGLKVYENMAIEGLSTPRDPKTGFDFYFTLTAREIIFATAATSKVPADALGAKGNTPAAIASTQRRAAAPVARGAQPTRPLTSHEAAQTDRVKAQATAKPQSWLKRGIQLLGG